MRIHTFAAVLAVATIVAGAVQAATPPAAPIAPVRARGQQTADVETWLAELSAWNSQFAQVGLTRSDHLLVLLEGAEKLASLSEAGDRRATRTWAEAWAVDTKARLAADLEAYSALPPNPPTAPASLASSPEVRQRTALMVESRDRIGTFLRQTSQSSDEYIDLVVKAATTGTPEDLMRAGSGTIVVSLAQIEAENLMMVHTRGPVGEPNYYMAGAVIASNNGLMAWMRYFRAVTFEEPVDRVASAAEVRRYATESRDAADGLVMAVGRTRARLAAEPGLRGTPLETVLATAMDLLDQGAEVERRIAQEVAALADAIEAGETELDEAAGARMEALVDERLALDQRRRAAIASLEN